jgi:hypothetical protein
MEDRPTISPWTKLSARTGSVADRELRNDRFCSGGAAEVPDQLSRVVS